MTEINVGVHRFGVSRIIGLTENIENFSNVLSRKYRYL